MAPSNDHDRRPFWKTPQFIIGSVTVPILAALITVLGPSVVHSSGGTTETAPSHTASATATTPSTSPPTTPTPPTGPTTTPPGSGPTISIPPPPPGPAILHHGFLAIQNGYAFDLDSTAANWSTRTGGEDDLTSFHDQNGAVGMMFAKGAASIGLDTTEDGSYAYCRSLAGYPNSFPNRFHLDLIDGKQYCVKTSEDRYSLMTVRVSEFDKVTFEVTTWKPQG